MTHKSKDYKISVVKYYNNDNIRKTCKIFYNQKPKIYVL